MVSVETILLGVSGDDLSGQRQSPMTVSPYQPLGILY